MAASARQAALRHLKKSDSAALVDWACLYEEKRQWEREQLYHADVDVDA